MDWRQQIDNYCERTDFTFWSEPVNALSNFSFLLFAWLVWRMIKNRDRYSQMLAIILGLIGIGSFLFHTFASRWAELADVLPITLFILAYLYFACRRFLELPRWAGLVAVLVFFPYSSALASILGGVFGPVNGSVAYFPVALLIAILGVIIFRRDSRTATGLFIGAAALAVSLVFRSIDIGVCQTFPQGTHFLWHLLNGAILGWMIRVMYRHQFA